MKRSSSLCLALGSVLLAGVAIEGARPRYGGTLRVETDASDLTVRDRVASLGFETLTRVDIPDGLQPHLALNWESDGKRGQWRFSMRPGVVLHDGSTLQAWQVAAALRTIETTWRITAENDKVIVEPDKPIPDLPWVVSQARYAVAVPSAGGAIVGTGPFRLENFRSPDHSRRQDGALRDGAENTTVQLRAHDVYWGGRPFLDAIQIESRRPQAEQLRDLESGRADVIAIRPADIRRVTQRGFRITASHPIELLALVFEPHRMGAADDAMRGQLESALDRHAMASALLQQRGEAALTLLPPWLSGYAPVVSTPHGRSNAPNSSVRLQPDPQVAAGARRNARRDLIVRVDPSDALAQDVAERIAVDAREAGFSVRVQAPTGLAPRADARVVRVRLQLTTPQRALTDIVGQLGAYVAAQALPGPLRADAPLDVVYRTEIELLERHCVIPVLHVPELYGLADRVVLLGASPVWPSGAWNFADVSLKDPNP
jgi:ABC-type transport system substrate-binding protein